MTSILAARAITGGPVARLEDRSDRDLLEQFFRGEAIGSQDAFRTLIERHGPSVLGICRHVLDRGHDAEDAFQATFLTLVKRGEAINDPAALSAWLREVAYRIALRMRYRAGRRRAMEQQVMAMALSRDEPGEQARVVDLSELRPVLREEVARLPEKYRVPVILSYLEGRTNQEVAELLRWPVGTVKGRLMRARQMLRSRLNHRSAALSESRPLC